MFGTLERFRTLHNFDDLDLEVQGVINFCSKSGGLSDYAIAQTAKRIILQSEAEVIKDLTQEWYARRIGFSSSYVCHTMKYYYKHTFGHFLMRRKLTIAKDFLINHPRLSIDQIAEKIGYSTGNYFIKVFKKQCGVTPYQYRKQLQLIPELKGPIKKLARELEMQINLDIERATYMEMMNSVTIHGGAKKRKPRKRVKFPG